ncbi:MAG: hypothetical protein WC612_06635 [Bdellovibrionales bacterium]|jgi:hypothetical protein
MPFILRDTSGKVVRASVQSIHGAEMVPYDHPDLTSFLEQNGQDPKKIEEALFELRRTDAEMSRAVEDVVMALLKKSVLKMTDLPKPVQDRMAFRVKLRVMIQDSFDQASGHNSDAFSFGSPADSTRTYSSNPYEVH